MIWWLSVALAQPVADGTVRRFRHTVTTEAAAADVWAVWTDVDGWSRWDAGLEQAHLDGAFVVGATGTLVSGGRETPFQVVALEPGVSYSFASRLPAGQLVVTRTLSREDGRTTFVHDVAFRGLGGALLAPFLGPRFRRLLPGVMDEVAALAEAR